MRDSTYRAGGYARPSSVRGTRQVVRSMSGIPASLFGSSTPPSSSMTFASMPGWYSPFRVQRGQWSIRSFSRPPCGVSKGEYPPKRTHRAPWQYGHTRRPVTRAACDALRWRCRRSRAHSSDTAMMRAAVGNHSSSVMMRSTASTKSTSSIFALPSAVSYPANSLDHSGTVPSRAGRQAFSTLSLLVNDALVIIVVLSPIGQDRLLCWVKIGD